MFKKKIQQKKLGKISGEPTRGISKGLFGRITGRIEIEFLRKNSGVFSAKISREIPSGMCGGIPRGSF